MIKKTKVKFDTIVFRGVSGALVAPIIASKMKKHLLVVRKRDDSHSYRNIEGYVGTKQFIIIDDLINTGGTIKAILQEIEHEGIIGNNAPDIKGCQGIFLYHSRAPRSTRQITLKSGLVLTIPCYDLCVQAEGENEGRYPYLQYFMGKGLRRSIIKHDKDNLPIDFECVLNKPK